MPDEIVLKRDLPRVVGLARTRVWQLERAGLFPARIKIGTGPTGKVGWLGSDIEAWLASRPRGICGKETATCS